ncbi:thioredoxin TrxC [Microvirga antarctica]|uniref:thioredoxin TrxC n=1 Tax=Microvirga antarctica TaxID=2819233 RepID=UPI001B30FA21|nr:thioredoxin TrxC [Microvirga antarctica]
MDDAGRHIVCPHCDAVNRIPPEREAGKAKCGRCHKRLFEGRALPVDTPRFDTHISRNDIPVVVDFWAAWCGPCKAMAPVYERVASELEPNLRFLKVDSDAEQALAARYNIRSIPTLMLFRQGRMVAQRAGASDAASLRAWLQQHRN